MTVCGFCKGTIGGYSVFIKIGIEYIACCCGEHADKLLALEESKKQGARKVTMKD